MINNISQDLNNLIENGKKISEKKKEIQINQEQVISNMMEQIINLVTLNKEKILKQFNDCFSQNEFYQNIQKDLEELTQTKILNENKYETIKNLKDFMDIKQPNSEKHVKEYEDFIRNHSINTEFVSMFINIFEKIFNNIDYQHFLKKNIDSFPFLFEKAEIMKSYDDLKTKMENVSKEMEQKEKMIEKMNAQIDTLKKEKETLTEKFDQDSLISKNTIIELENKLNQNNHQIFENAI